MIRYKDGDLIKMAQNKEFDVIAHCANCFCTFGAGIALQIKHALPEAFVADCETKAGDEAKLGSLSFSQKDGLTVVNLYGQFDFKGRRQGKIDLDYDALRSSLKEMKEKFSGKLIGLPKIGSDLAGGDWTIIEKIIEEEMMGEHVTIINYVP